jgi:hypothetical protein
MLETHRDKLEKLALALLEKETMDIAEIEELLGMKSVFAEEIPAETIAPEGTPDAGSAV